ncbi:M20 family metallopeptidase [Virgibacillus kekensis]|uniref:M20 family metallopeptidase n=1 Tax=Virgibacillus kekensis TaxID=202261 RepID=A0ABV9DG74_9BACI
MDRTKLYMERNLNEIVSDIKFLVKQDSPTNDKNLTDLCGKRIQKLLKLYFGRFAEEFKEKEYGNHLRFQVGEGEKQILILSHFDTVWDEGELPYKEDGNKLYGPGILDMKGGLVQAIWAVKACLELDSSFSKKIVFLFTSDEEIGSPTGRKLIEKEAANSSYVFVTEPPVAKTGALKTERKGSSRYYIDIKGKAAHSGNHHKDGISAIKEAAEQIIYLESLTDYEKGTTINVGAIEGGGPVNVVSDHATIGVDVRTESEEEQERIDHIIEELQPYTEGAELEVHGGISRPPMHKNEDTEALFKQAKRAAAELGLELKEASAGGGSDGNFTASMGIPTLDGLGAEGFGIHARNEHILKDRIPYRAALLSKLIQSL